MQFDQSSPVKPNPETKNLEKSGKIAICLFCDYMHNNFVGEKNSPFLIVSLQTNICNTSYDQKAQRHMEVGFFLAVK